MTQTKNMRVAVIGAGISGIATAKVLKKNGFEAILFEKSEKLGGVWATAYPEVHLQNIYTQYHLSDFDWPFKPDLHPSGEQILRYLNMAVEYFKLDVRLKHEVVELNEQDNRWLLQYKNKDGLHEELFDYVILATGQYTEGKNDLHFPGQDQFSGQIITERDVTSLSIFNEKQVAVVGYGKSALDMATLAAEQGAQVHHVFRSPSWLIPEWILGAHFTYALFTRFGNIMMTSWAQPTAMERFLHNRLGFVIKGFWSFIQNIVRYQLEKNGKGKDQAAKDRLKVIQPSHTILMDFRSSGALGPENYYPYVAAGKILPYHSEVSSFSQNAIQLKNGVEIPCDLVVLSVGYKMPTFSFLPAKYRELLETENGGTQLYRHLIHPHIPRLGFTGFNHGYMHVPAVEIGTQWLCAYFRNELGFPPIEEMEKSMESVRSWKLANLRFENSGMYAVSTRFQQYIDILLMELKVSPYRKLPNVFAEVFGRYESSDYKGIAEEYERKKLKRTVPLQTLPIDT